MSTDLSLLQRLHSTDVDVRRVALTELDQILDSVSLEDLLPLLRDEDAAVRKLAIEVLEEMGNVRAIPELLERVQDENEEVGTAARIALREFRTPAAVTPLIQGVGHPVAKVREAAIRALRDLRAPATKPALRLAALDPDPTVRKEAILALGYLRLPETLSVFQDALLDPDPGIRRVAVATLGSFGKLIIPDLIRLSSDRDWQVRAEAVNALGQFQTEAVMSALLAALEDEAWQIVRLAIIGLGKPNFCVADRLVSFLGNQIADIRISAAASLGEIGDPVVLPRLRTLLADADTGVQKAAKRSIAQLEHQSSGKNPS